MINPTTARLRPTTGTCFASLLGVVMIGKVGWRGLRSEPWCKKKPGFLNYQKLTISPREKDDKATASCPTPRNLTRRPPDYPGARFLHTACRRARHRSARCAG